MAPTQTTVTVAMTVTSESGVLLFPSVASLWEESLRSLKVQKELRTAAVGQIALCALLHAGSEAAQMKGFAVSTAFPLSKYKQPQALVQQRGSQLPDPSPAAGPGRAS